MAGMAMYQEMMEEVRAAYNSGKTRNLEWRTAQLKALVKLMTDNSELIKEALYKDLHKHHMESHIMEVQICISDAIDAINELESWAKPQKVKRGVAYTMVDAYVKPEPYGVALVIGAWNYPLQLVLSPVIGAIAAGNCVVIKPSELSEATAELLEELIPKYLDNDCIKVVNGAVPETSALLKEKFDIILYTGNGTVAKIVMTAAAQHLTPCILELGGKSPVFVDNNVDLAIAARRIAWGKFANAGQTCIAPDYVMCTKDTQDKFIDAMKNSVKDFFGDEPRKCDSYGRIVNKRHFQRIQKLKQGSTPASEGEDVEEEKYIAPTLLRDVKLTDPIMQEEIFGPLLPILTVRDHKEAIKIINERDKPLALYLFTNNKSMIKDFRDQTSSGALSVNDTVVHAGLATLPFGGVGGSGMGAYHGKHSFDAFSHSKPVMEGTLSLDSMQWMRYPPYTEKKMGWLQWMLKKKVKKTGMFSFLPFMIIGTLLAVMFKTVGVTAAGLPGSPNDRQK